MGAVRLTVNDIDRTHEFYERAIGLRVLERGGERLRLGAGDVPLVELSSSPDAPPRPPRTSGLFHLAILVPSRLELAHALRRVLEAGARLSGASDHLVSESLYLSDPEGNGIEIYRDRPRGEWPRTNGTVQMATLPLDLEGLVGELRADGEERSRMPAGTRIGHVHLQVANLGEAEAFYAGILGFEVTVRSYPGALFLSAGGYHHHIGLNTWAGDGAPPPPPGAVGLRSFEVVLPSTDQLDRLVERLHAEGFTPERAEDGMLLSDPSQNTVTFTTPEEEAQ